MVSPQRTLYTEAYKTKDKLVRKPDDSKHEVQGVPLNLNKAVLV